jgi:DUF1365 family protein
MIDYQQGQKLFDASLALKRREITRASMASILIRYPILTGKVVAMIYWQALRLTLKRTPFFTHPQKIESVVERTSK